MNLSLNWLKDYVGVSDITIKDLCDALTMSGSKVEKVKNLAEPLRKVVIGKITGIKKHEDSDKLWITQADVGEHGSVQVVTGAQNVFEGAIVPVVLDGGVVISHKDGEVIKIKKGKLRGEVSEGMLCGPDELRQEGDPSGIWILNDVDGISDAPIGSCMLEFLGLDDTVIEFEITNNRPDCFSVIGLAREVAATLSQLRANGAEPLALRAAGEPCLLGAELKLPQPDFKGTDAEYDIDVSVENTELCSRYMAAIVRNVKIAASPRWMQLRLKAHGIRPINNIVDITNYVMLEFGNPLHAFDQANIAGNRIIVRNAKDGEEITLLDGNTVALDSSILVIADGEKPVAVAGVMGGEFSGVTDDTTDIVFEAACFDKASVRRAAKKIGRRTESSSRFEKGLNPANTQAALFRALQLVEELGIGEVSKAIDDIAPYALTLGEPLKIPHNAAWINGFLGANISESEQIAIFERLGLGYDSGAVIVPDWRGDLQIPQDLAEEVARIYGYNKIESRLPRLAANTSSSREESNLRKLVNALLAQGCNECITYSFVSPEMNRTAGKGDAVALRNPFGEETSVMRTSLLPSMLKVVKNNLNSGNSAGRLFELGRIYTGESEPEKLCIALFGKDEDFYTLKGVFEAILAAFKLPLSINSITRHTDAPYHPGRAAACDYVVFGEISPLILAEYDIDTRVYAAEIDIAKFFAQCENKLIFTHLPKYPDSVRDLSLVCTQDTASGEVIALIEGACKAILQRVEFFDVFELSDGQKSLSYKLTFRKADGTLTSDEVEQGIGKILKALEQNNIKLRS